MPERFNELSQTYQNKIKSIIENRIQMKSDEPGDTQAAKDEKAEAMKTLNNFNRTQKKPMMISILDQRPMKPYLEFVALKDFEASINDHGSGKGAGSGASGSKTDKSISTSPFKLGGFGA